MKHYPNNFLGVLVVCGAWLACCGTSRPPTERVVSRGLDAAERSVARRDGAEPSDPARARPIAIIDGREITLEQLRPSLMEAAGGTVLEERALDVLLEREAQARGLRITDAQIEAEKVLLLATFADAGIARSDDEAARLLRTIREARGLGGARYAALLRRNATLRALVASEVVMNDAGLSQARELRFGERRRARLIVTAGAAEATRVIERVRAGEEFSIVAAEASIDRSAERGGVLEPISLADPTYPAALRAALRSMQPGELSPPIAVEQGYAIVRLDEVIAASTPTMDAAAQNSMLARDVRTQQERILMNQLARRLLDGATITILDRALDEAWEARKRRP